MKGIGKINGLPMRLCSPPPSPRDSHAAMNCKVCHNVSTKNPSLSFFRFPSDYNRCREWAERCNILAAFDQSKPGEFYKSFRICSDHFEPTHIVFDGRKRKLLSCAVPNRRHPGGRMEETQSDSDNDLTLQLLKNLCRFCAEENTDLTDIYSWRGKTLDLEEKIKVFPIVVNKCDKLPLKICNRCIVKISKFHDFVKNCVKADIRLKTILGIKDTDTPDANAKRFKLDEANGNVVALVAPEAPPKNSGLSEGVEVRRWVPEDGSSGDYQRLQRTSNEVLMKAQQGDRDVITSKCTCGVCFKTFATPEILESHWRAHSLQPDEHGRFICQTCDKVFVNKYRLNEHIRLHTGEYPFVCSVCGKKFHRMSLLKQHSAVHESRKRFACSVCNLRSSRKGNLIQHLRTHFRGQSSEQSKMGVFHCWTCGLAYPAEGDLMEHRKATHAQVFDTSSQPDILSLELPQTIHFEQDTPERRLTCGLCRQHFTGLEPLKRHFALHETARKRTCTHHQKELEPRDGSSSRETQSGGSRVECAECIRSGIGGDVRLNLKLYRCEECGVDFRRKDTLRNHVRIHTGERPFVCKDCGFAFKQRGDCMKHERNHQRESEDILEF